MLETVKYQNHLGEEINFSENGIYVKSSDLHDYAWNYTERGGKITSFKRDVIKSGMLWLNALKKMSLQNSRVKFSSTGTI